ncbi:MAG TPA: hypothetical protein DCZ92_09000 [Elusimicrobia bacterium]|nr:hypothetical protein [Elusimicrobiota bacterium]
MDFFHWQMDYIFFFYGLAFLLLAVVCYFLRKDAEGGPEWRWLAFFGAAHGLNEWLDMVAVTFVDGLAFAAVRLFVMAVSFFFLFEFGRRSLKGPAGALPWPRICAALLLFAAAGGFYGLNGLNAGLRYCLGLSGGLLSCLALYQAAAGKKQELRLPLLAAGAGIGLYAIATGLVVPASGFLLARWVNFGSFAGLFGFPVQLLRGVLAVWIACAAWTYLLNLDIAEAAGSPHSERKKKIGQLVIAVSLLGVLAGWALTGYLSRWSMKDLAGYSFSQTNVLHQRLEGVLSGVEQTAATMSGSPWIAPTFRARSAADLEKANSVLDRYCSLNEMSVCYLLDAKGVTIASSNRAAPDSFVGKSYAFRPYFKAAMDGKTGRYFALGVTSGERGYYAGAPVRDGAGKITGVVAVKKAMELLSEDFQAFSYMFLTSPEGIIFLSSQKDLLFRSLWPLEEKQRAELAASKQFGTLSFDHLLPKKPENGAMLNYQGADYFGTSFEVGNEGWLLFSFSGLGLLHSARLLGILITAVFCLLVLTSFLMLIESETKRETAEKLLKLKEEVKTLSGIVPICASCKKIRDDKGYWDRVETYVSKHTEARFSHGLCPDCVKKIYPDYAEDKNKE